MADFRKLALEFVLSDDPNRQTAITNEAAGAIQSAPRPSNPVARWVESIRPWMPSVNDDQMDEGEDGESSGDIIARSKALSFLAGTLEHLEPDFLKTDQVNLLVAFFGSMFKVDHKAGILPAAVALHRTAGMKAFQPQKGNDIIQSVCSLGEDFKNQVVDTRAAVYELLDHLITNVDVANDLQYQHGATSGFITDLLQLCRNERDPSCLMTWFRILRTFLAEYTPAQEVVDEIFSIFSAYFPISLRTSQHPSGITADDLKSTLRECFSAHHRVASKAIPYLIGRLDQGDSVTVNVKVDILKTLTACLSKYEHVQQGVVPFVDKIWSCLKYEVRNGEIEDTTNATLEVIRTIAKRLTGDELRDFALTVQRDCLEDLANPIYTAASGKLLISVHSAKPATFALMIAPSVTHVKENLRHTKSPEHTKNLLVLLNSLFELRQVLIGGDVNLTPEEAEAFKLTEPMLAPLYKQAYLYPFQQALQEGAQKEEVTIGQQAIKGMGLMVCQRAAQTGQSTQPMLPEATLSEICDDLASVMVKAPEKYTTDEARADLVDEAVLALQKATMAYSPALTKLVEESFRVCEPYIASPETTSVSSLVETLQQIIPKLAFISCSAVPKQGSKFDNYVLLLSVLLKNLQSMLDVKAPPQVWSVFATGIQMTMRYYREAVQTFIPRSEALNFDDSRFHPNTWVNYVAHRYPALLCIDGDGPEPSSIGEAMDVDSLGGSSDEVRGEFILVSLFVVRQLYRRATRIISFADDTELSLELSADFVNKDVDARSFEDRYLHLVGSMATFVISGMNELQQTALLLNEEVVTLFRGDDEYLHSDAARAHPWANAHLRDAMLRTFSPQPSYSMRDPPKFPISGFSQGRAVVLSLGVVQPLHPTVVELMVARGTAHQILIAGLLLRDHSASPRCRHIVSAILTILANKYPVESWTEIMTMVQHQMNFVVSDGNLSKETEGETGFLEFEENKIPGEHPDQARASLARPVYAITAGILRRSGNSMEQVLSAILQGPANKKIGHILARNLETVFAPYESLKKQYFGFVKPLWMQRAYFKLVKPILAKAWPAGSNSPDDMLVAANYSVAVLAAVKHIRFEIYEDDTEDLVRLILCAVRYLPSGGDVQAGLGVLEEITRKSPDRVKPFLKSIIEASMSIFIRGSGGLQTTNNGEDTAWMPAGYIPFDHSGVSQAQCRCLVVRLLGLLPPHFEHRHLLDSAAHVRRMLAQASGDRVREVRKAALAARAAWVDVK